MFTGISSLFYTSTPDVDQTPGPCADWGKLSILSLPLHPHSPIDFITIKYSTMADDEERIKAEKLAAAKKKVSHPHERLVQRLSNPVVLQVAQMQKKKKKASKTSTAGLEAPKEADTSTEAEPTDVPAATETPSQTDTPAEEPKSHDEPAAESAPAAAAQSDELQQSQEKTETDAPVESPVEPMPPAPTSPGSDAEPLPTRLDTPRANHGRQPSLSIQSKMRSSSFRKTSVSHGSVSPSPSATLKSPGASLPPLTGDGESVHEVFRKQSTKIEELEKENRRLEKDLSDATSRWRKTEEQVEDLREASADGAELRERLKKAEEQVAGIEALVCYLVRGSTCGICANLIE